MSAEAPARYDVFLTLEGPGGSLETPNTGNPVIGSLAHVLEQLASGLPSFETLGVRITGVRIVRA